MKPYPWTQADHTPEIDAAAQLAGEAQADREALAAEAQQTQTFAKGTIAMCNRCGAKSALPKDCQAVPSDKAGRVWRLTTMSTLACGHMDSHWVAKESAS